MYVERPSRESGVAYYVKRTRHHSEMRCNKKDGTHVEYFLDSGNFQIMFCRSYY